MPRLYMSMKRSQETRWQLQGLDFSARSGRIGYEPLPVDRGRRQPIAKAATVEVTVETYLLQVSVRRLQPSVGVMMSVDAHHR